MPKVLSYEDQQYDRKEDTLGILRQSYEDIKYDANSSGGWNRKVVDVDGLTMKLSGDVATFTYHSVVVGDQYKLATEEENYKKYIDSFVSELKKRFKKQSKKTLELKKVDERTSYEKVGQLSPETSGMFGARNKMVGKYLIRFMVAYKYSF